MQDVFNFPLLFKHNDDELWRMHYAVCVLYYNERIDLINV